MGGQVNENSGAGKSPAKGKKKKKEKFDPLSDDPIVFQKVDFDATDVPAELLEAKAKEAKEKARLEKQTQTEAAAAEKRAAEEEAARAKAEEKARKKEARAEEEMRKKEVAAAKKAEKMAKKGKGLGKGVEEVLKEDVTATLSQVKIQGNGGKKPPKGGKARKDKQGKKEKQLYNSPSMSISQFIKEYSTSHVAATPKKVTPVIQEEEDEWTWESYTPESSTEDLIKNKKGKKSAKQKAKKKAVVEEEGEEETEEDEMDIMAQILGMKALATAQVTAEETEAEGVEVVVQVEPKKKKPKPKEKKPKVDKRMTAAELEQMAQRQAEEIEKAAQEERLRLAEERRVAQEKEKREHFEQSLRNDQLVSTLEQIEIIKEGWLKKACENEELHKWAEYLKSDGMPSIYTCPELTMYLHFWDNIMEKITLEEAIVKARESLQLLESLKQLIESPAGARKSEIENWKWVHGLLRGHMAKSMQWATYRLLRDVNRNFRRSGRDIYTADFFRMDEHVSLYLWLRVPMPPSRPNPKTEQLPRIHLQVKEMKLDVWFPLSVHCRNMAIRLMYLKYDHLSDHCKTFHDPPVPEQLSQDLLYVTRQEWLSKLFYKYENRDLPEDDEGKDDENKENQSPKKKSAPVQEEVVDKENGIIPIVPYRKLNPTASEYVIAEEEQIYWEVRQSLMEVELAEFEINLRQYLVIGGMYCFSYFHQTPQPRPYVTMQLDVSRLETPQRLWEATFHEDYTPSPPINPQLFQKEKDYLEAVKKQMEERNVLILVTVSLPTHVLWLNVPTICFWDDEKKVWTCKDVHEVEFEEESSTFTFGSGRFGYFSFAVNRHVNLPFRWWKMNPEENGTITLTLSAAVLEVTFNIKDDLICITEMKNTPTKALAGLVGRYYKILREGGLDLFPSFDTFCYVADTCEKHWPVEKHTYHIMGKVGACFDFCWSQWNRPAGRRNLVVQMREHRGPRERQLPYSLAQITPLKAAYINCAEDSLDFTDEPTEGMNFYSDLLHLVKGTVKVAIRTKYQSTPPQLCKTVADILLALRVFSFC